MAMFGIIRAKLANGARRVLTARTARRLIKQQDGAAAVEFALVAAPFLALVFAIMETAVVFFAGQALETAVADSSRLIMTGQAQNAAFTQAQFKNAVCAKLTVMFDCVNGVSIDVQSYPTFATVDKPYVCLDNTSTTVPEDPPTRNFLGG